MTKFVALRPKLYAQWEWGQEVQGSQEVCCEEDTRLQGLQAVPISGAKHVQETADVPEQATQTLYGQGEQDCSEQRRLQASHTKLWHEYIHA